MELEINQELEVTIERLGVFGEGVSKSSGFTLFIEGALPGELVKIQISELRKTFGRGKLLKVITPSKERVIPPCPVFGSCGGCQLMHLKYEAQLKHKQEKVQDALERIGKFTGTVVQPCTPSPLPLKYRNKIQLPFVEGELGLYARNSHHLIPIEECLIHCELGEKAFLKLKTELKSFPQKELLKHVLIKTAVNNKEILVIFVTSSPKIEDLIPFALHLMKSVPEIKGVIHNLQKDSSNVILGKEFTLLAGAPYIEETLHGLTFKVSPASFFQVNPLQAEKLYAKVVEFAALKGDETVLDAYCGVGTLSLILARKAKKVLGVECVREAITDAKENSKRNHITNTTFTCGQTENYLLTLQNIDVAILNPPRKGCEKTVLDRLLILKPKKIIYVSCDPATLARDLSLLKEGGFYLKEVQPFDMFPQTFHVETVALLERE